MKFEERLSAKITKFVPSLTLALKTRANERRVNGLPVYDFGLGETQGALSPVLREAGERAFREEQTMYTDPGGIAELRDEVLKWLSVEEHYSRENVVISTGAKQSLFNIFLAVCNPGDVVLFDAAPWVSYVPLAQATYCVPVMVLPLDRTSNYLKVTPQDLKRNLELRPHAKLFLLNNPVNPTAQLYSEQEVNDLLDVCVEYQIYFVLDRLYWKILFDDVKYPEPRVDEKTRPWLIQVDGMSKNFRRAGGLRIGWSVADDDVTKAMVNLQSHYTASPATPAQQVALAAISKEYDPVMVNELRHKQEMVTKMAKRIPYVDIFPSPATFYSFWDVSKAFGKRTPAGKVLENSDDVAAYLTEEHGVLTASGTGFLQDGYLRLSISAPDEIVEGGMKALRAAFKALR